MQVGDLVKCDRCGWMGLVVGESTHEDSGEEHLLVRWITGRYSGETDALWPPELELLCK